MKRGSLALGLILLCASPAIAKRLAPHPLAPIIRDGVKYDAPLWASPPDRDQNGGFIEAHSLETDRLLWRLKVYEVKHDPRLESDVQDVFITTMRFMDGRLEVTNERGATYLIDVDQKKVISGGPRRREAEEPITAQYNFLLGSYECVGRWPDSKKTYSGRVRISEAGQGVKIVRLIDGKKTEAAGKFNTATADKIQVLTMKFRQDQADYEETCLVSGDLDNYPRMTCYLYTQTSKKVGLETLFPDHGQLERP
jgi:hypothetical protein